MRFSVQFFLVCLLLYPTVGESQISGQLEVPYFNLVSIQEFEYSDDDNQLFSRSAMCRWNNGLLIASRIDDNNHVVLKYFKDFSSDVQDIVLEFPKDILLWDIVHTLGKKDKFLIVHTFGLVSFFDQDFKWVKSLHVSEKIDKLEFSNDNTVGWGADSNELYGRSLLIEAYDYDFNVIHTYSRKIRVPELMYFSQGDLVKLVGNRVVFCEMDRPEFFLLNEQFEVVDSLDVGVDGWKSAQSMPDLLPLTLDNIISYFTENGGSKLMGLASLNDSMFIASGIIGSNKDVNILLEIRKDRLNHLRSSHLNEDELHYKNPSTIDTKILELSDIRFLCQIRLGHFLEGKFYYIYELEPGFLGKTYTEYKLGESFYKKRDSRRLTLTVSEIMF